MKIHQLFKSLFLALVLLIFLSCSDEANGEVRIRIQNESNYEYRDVRIGDGELIHEFGDIPAGGSTTYEIFQNAYRYAYVELTIDEEVYYLQPIDFVGEEKLTVGKYTYIIAADDSTSVFGRLTLTLRED